MFVRFKSPAGCSKSTRHERSIDKAKPKIFIFTFIGVSRAQYARRKVGEGIVFFIY